MTKNFRTLISVGLALTVANLFTLGSFAYTRSKSIPIISASESTQAPQQPAIGGDTALLNGRGHITINGNDAKPGSTVVSGNTVGAGGGSFASIEMGPALGRIELKSDTTVSTTFAPGLVVDDFIQCGHMTEVVPPGVTCVVHDTHNDTAKVIVKSGQVVVKYSGGEKTLKAGDSKTFDRLSEVDTTGECTFTIECGHHIAGIYWAGGGLLALVGIGVGVGLTQLNSGGSNSGSNPVLSGANP